MSLAQVWQTVAAGLPFAPEQVRACSLTEIWSLMRVAAWNDHGHTLEALMDACPWLRSAPLGVFGNHSLLKSAVLHGSFFAATALLCAKADVDQLDMQGYSPLFHALENGDACINPPLSAESVACASPARASDPWCMVSLLVQAKAHVDGNGRYGKALLPHAAARGRAGAVWVFLRAGARVDDRDDSGETALVYAARRGDAGIVAQLLGARAGVDLCGKDHTPLQAVAFAPYIGVRTWPRVKHVPLDEARCRSTVTQLLAAKATIRLQAASSHDSMDLAAKAGNVAACAELLAAKASVHRYDPVVYAAAKGHVDILTLLVQAKAALNRGSVTATPLIKAASKGHADIVALLVQAKAEVDLANSFNTPLSKAASHGYVDIVTLLVQAKAEVNPCRRQYTPLHRAAKRGHARVLAVLLEAKACPTATDTTWRTPLDYAKSAAVIALLKAAAGAETRAAVRAADGLAAPGPAPALAPGPAHAPAPAPAPAPGPAPHAGKSRMSRATTDGGASKVARIDA
jgi:ankyrin repeat protein